MELPAGASITPDGMMTLPDGTKKRFTIPGKDAVIDTDDDVIVEPYADQKDRDRSVLREDGSILLTDGGKVTYPDGKVVLVPDGTIVLPDGTIIWPEGARLGFWDCCFHWLEILAMLIATLLFAVRLRKVSRHISEAEELTQAAQPSLVQLEELEKKERMAVRFMYGMFIAFPVILTAVLYEVVDGHCMADLPILVVMILHYAVFMLLLAGRQRAFGRILGEFRTEDPGKENK